MSDQSEPEDLSEQQLLALHDNRQALSASLVGRQIRKRSKRKSSSSDSAPKRRRRGTRVTASAVEKAVAEAQLRLEDGVPIPIAVPGPSNMPDPTELDFSTMSASVSHNQDPSVTLILPVTEIDSGARVICRRPHDLAAGGESRAKIGAEINDYAITAGVMIFFFQCIPTIFVIFKIVKNDHYFQKYAIMSKLYNCSKAVKERHTGNLGNGESGSQETNTL